MDPVSLFVAGMIGFSNPAPAAMPAPDASPGPLVRWRPWVAEAAERFDLPVPWIEAVMRAESGGQAVRGGRPITSPAGAIGLMQVMPGTYEELRRRHRLGPDPADPRDNILAGSAYLREMHDRFGSPGFLAAYHAGPERYQAFLRTGQPLPQETRRYLAQLTPQIAAGGTPSDTDPVSPIPPLLQALRDSAVGEPPAGPDPAGGALFAIGGKPDRASEQPRPPAPGGGLFVPLARSPADR